MRYLFVVLTLTFGVFAKPVCDAGDCVKYEVDIELTSGQTIRGFVYMLTYGTRFDFKEISFLEYETRKNSTDTLHVYKNIRQLRFPTTNYGNEKCEFHFDATDEYLKINKKKIKTINVLSYGVCNNCDYANEQNGYTWNGIYPTIITELTKSEIDLLATPPIASMTFGEDTENYDDIYWLISYSPLYSSTELERSIKDYKAGADKLSKEGKPEIVEVKYRTFKTELRKKGVIVFKIGLAE